MIKLVLIIYLLSLTPMIYSDGHGKKEDCQKCTIDKKEVCDTKACPKSKCEKKNWMSSDSVAKINTIALKTILDSKTPVIVLDARSGKYDDGQRIPGAKSLAAGASEDQVKKIIPDKKTLIVTYCSNIKCPASHKLYVHLKKLGYSNILELPEGIQGWIAQGFSVEKA